MSATLFELNEFEETTHVPLGIQPCCEICGALGPIIREEEGIVPTLRAAAMLGIVALAEHRREMHQKGAA